MTIYDNSNQNVSQVAKSYYDSGLAIIPIKPDTSKSPIIKWKQYHSSRPLWSNLRNYFLNDYGIGILCGQPSGGLEVLDFDSAGVAFRPFIRQVSRERKGLLTLCPIVQTPSQGFHLFYRCTTVAGNQRLARKLDDNGQAKILIETRGQGGYVATAGSPLTTHKSGKPYRVVHGDLTVIPTITSNDREYLLSVAKSFNELNDAPSGQSGRVYPLCPAIPLRGQGKSVHREKVGDMFNAVAKWEDILLPLQWTIAGYEGSKTYWTRPNKTEGISATTGYGDSDTLYVFSTNAPLPPSPPAYNKFYAYTLLYHGGDYKQAIQTINHLWSNLYE